MYATLMRAALAAVIALVVLLILWGHLAFAGALATGVVIGFGWFLWPYAWVRLVLLKEWVFG
ncbi:hypothetical protein [Oceanicaulis sp.]|uniref:hypothetical protein n=1 Tax=Oceanicaulis sp. TaxID=1924941 RepID=UPI003D275390